MALPPRWPSAAYPSARAGVDHEELPGGGEEMLQVARPEDLPCTAGAICPILSLERSERRSVGDREGRGRHHASHDIAFTPGVSNSSSPSGIVLRDPAVARRGVRARPGDEGAAAAGAAGVLEPARGRRAGRAEAPSGATRLARGADRAVPRSAPGPDARGVH